jgi:hypothetical protein
MIGSTTCPGCGLQLPVSGVPWDQRRNASPECWQLYGEVQGFELRHLERLPSADRGCLRRSARPTRWGRDVPPISVAYALVGLHLALDRGASGIEVRTAHQRMGKPDPSWPRLPTPERTGGMTVFDVAAAGAMIGSVTGHAEAVRAWATAVWQAWAAWHTMVAALTDRLLR